MIGAGFKMVRFADEEIVRLIERARGWIILFVQEAEQSTPLFPRQRGTEKRLLPLEV